MFGRTSVADSAIGSTRPRPRRRTSSLQTAIQAMHALFLQQRKATICWKIAQKIYHKYGLKHIVLLLALVLYGLFGASIFLFIEGPAEQRLKLEWRSDLDQIRSTFVQQLIGELFNNSRYVIFLPSWKTKPLADHLWKRLDDFERQLGVTFDPQHKIDWDYWNAVLYAGTICTTIGYGHIYPRTPAGRILTCIYALFGIPLVLTVLNDLGKLLTVSLKYPWFQCKRVLRRIVRLCTNQSMEKIISLERRERDNLAIFDLPIPVAVGLIIGWIFLCSATFLMWEKRWTYLEAFYFFFISLSTIGLGDIVPDQPKYLLMMFGYIIVGLSLVSMSVSLIQIKLEAYHGGVFRHKRPTSVHFAEEELLPEVSRSTYSPGSRTTLGIIQSGSASEISSITTKQTTTRACQTILTFPTTRQMVVTRQGNRAAVRLMKSKTHSLSNLLQADREIQQQDLVRDALANVGNAATVIIFLGDHAKNYSEQKNLKIDGPQSISAYDDTVLNGYRDDSKIRTLDTNRNEPT